MKRIQPIYLMQLLVLGLLINLGNLLMGQPFAYVANTLSNDVSVIDLANNSIINTIPTEGLIPVDIAVSPNGNTLAVVNATSSTVTLIDVGTNTFLDTFSIAESGTLPFDVVFAPDGNSIYVSYLTASLVKNIDLAGNELAAITINTGPSAMAVRPGTNELLVILSADGVLGKIDLTNNTVLSDRIELEGASGGSSSNPFEVAISADGNRILVPNSSSNFSNIVDLTTNTKIRLQEFFFDAFLSSAIGAAISPDGATGILIEQGGGGQVNFVDMTNGNITNTLTIGGDPNGVSISPDGTTAAVALSASNQVAIINMNTQTVVTNINVGNTPRDLLIVNAPLCPANPVTTIFDETICDNETFFFGGQQLNVPGTYRDTLLTPDGCDSVLVLNLTVNPTATNSISATICQGESFTFGGQQLTLDDVYQETFQTSLGCDSVVTLTLTVNPVPTTNLSAAICDGASFSFGGQQLTTAGTYRDTLQTAAGCDSILVLDLTVNPTFTENASAFICVGQSFTFGTQVLTTSGTYNETFQSAAGCDSMVTLTLTVGDETIVNFTGTICEGESFPFEGQVLTESGVYRDTLQTSTGCDSINVLTLTVNPVERTSISASICDNESLEFGGSTLTMAGEYRDTLSTVAGCDSIITLTLTVNSTQETQLSETICANEPFSFAGQTLTTSGVYRDTLSTTEGCDSIVVLTLTVDPVPITQVSASICDGETFDFNGEMLDNAGVFSDSLTTAAGCDSIIVLTLSLNPVENTIVIDSIPEGGSIEFGGEIINMAGTYTDTLTTAAGCDSIITLNLGILTGLPFGVSQEMKIMPNPFSTFVVIESDRSGPATATLFDLRGKAILQERFFMASTYRLDLPTLTEGVYTLWLEVDGQRFVQKIMKE